MLRDDDPVECVEITVDSGEAIDHMIAALDFFHGVCDKQLPQNIDSRDLQVNIAAVGMLTQALAKAAAKRTGDGPQAGQVFISGVAEGIGSVICDGLADAEDLDDPRFKDITVFLTTRVFSVVASAFGKGMFASKAPPKSSLN